MTDEPGFERGMNIDKHASAYESLARQLLADCFTPEGVVAWMNGKLGSLKGENPTAMIQRGEGLEVLQRIEQLRSGTFSWASVTIATSAAPT